MLRPRYPLETARLVLRPFEAEDLDAADTRSTLDAGTFTDSP